MMKPLRDRLLALGLVLFFSTFSHCATSTNDTDIILDSSSPLESEFNLNRTFYLVERSNASSSSSTSRLPEEDETNEVVSSTENPPVDDDAFWDTPAVVTTSTPRSTEPITDADNEVSVVTFRVTVTSTPAPITTLPTSTNTTSSPPSTTPRPSTSASTLATVRLHSNIVTVKPDLRISTSTTPSTTTTTTTTKKPKKNKVQPKNDFNSVELISITDTEEPADNNIWKMTLHGTNMNSEELRMVNKTLLVIHFKPYSRRKVARQLKKELDTVFSAYHYRFSVIVQTTSRNTMGKALHGVWLSMSLNGIHYFITATYRIVDGPKLKEEELDKIEYWSTVHSIQSHNMTGYRKYNRIASKLKMDLDRQYGHGNVWSVVIVKNRYLVKARALEDVESSVEFNRLNGGHYIVFRGGQNIDDSSRNARYMSMGVEKDDEETSEHSFREFANENNRSR